MTDSQIIELYRQNRIMLSILSTFYLSNNISKNEILAMELFECATELTAEFFRTELNDD